MFFLPLKRRWNDWRIHQLLGSRSKQQKPIKCQIDPEVPIRISQEGKLRESLFREIHKTNEEHKNASDLQGVIDTSRDR